MNLVAKINKTLLEKGRLARITSTMVKFSVTMALSQMDTFLVLELIWRVQSKLTPGTFITTA